jgi:ABC-type multidrug transport system fused ATPase/permease subunit
LDSESEGLVQKAIRESGKGKSVIAIAHRLSTIQHADIIHVLNDGVVAERGNHGELMSKKGIYYYDQFEHVLLRLLFLLTIRQCLSQGVESTP